MIKLNKTLAEIKTGDYPKLMTHVVLGYPTLEKSIEIAITMANSGASFIELQIPFSDPMADGPTIMRACEVALEQKVSPKDCMIAMEKIAAKTDVPLIFMSYFNLIFNYGVEKFCKDASKAGAQALIIPDILPEDKKENYWNIARENNLSPTTLVSPVSTQERFDTIKEKALDGFVYCIATTGTTGARKELELDLKDYLAKVKKEINLPRAVGFGISSKEQIKSLQGHTEIAIVGSAMINKITSAKDVLAEVADYTKELSNT